VPVEITGFEIAEIDLRLDEARESRGSAPTEPEDNTPAHAAGSSTTQTGDMWLLGRHRLLCGDARAGGTYEALLQEQKAQYRKSYRATSG
jgi:hypothetical protein